MRFLEPSADGYNAAELDEMDDEREVVKSGSLPDWMRDEDMRTNLERAADGDEPKEF